jgi:hypothetical protein
MSNGHPIDSIDGIYSTLNNVSQTDGTAPLGLGLPHLALHPNVMGLLNGANEDEEESTEDEMEWEEVDLRAATTTNGTSGLPTQDVTITLSENVDKPKLLSFHTGSYTKLLIFVTPENVPRIHYISNSD